VAVGSLGETRFGRPEEARIRDNRLSRVGRLTVPRRAVCPLSKTGKKRYSNYMNENDPITPPPELVQQWIEEGPPLNQPKHVAYFIAERAAQWGADQELKALPE